MSWLTGLRRRCWLHEMTLTVMLRMHTANGCATRFECITPIVIHYASQKCWHEYGCSFLSVDQNQMKAADCILLFVVSIYFFEFDSTVQTVV